MRNSVQLKLYFKGKNEEKKHNKNCIFSKSMFAAKNILRKNMKKKMCAAKTTHFEEK